MAIKGFQNRDPNNKRWAEKGIEETIKKMQREIEALKTEVKRLGGRLK